MSKAIESQVGDWYPLLDPIVNSDYFRTVATQIKKCKAEGKECSKDSTSCSKKAHAEVPAEGEEAHACTAACQEEGSECPHHH